MQSCGNPDAKSDIMHWVLKLDFKFEMATEPLVCTAAPENADRKPTQGLISSAPLLNTSGLVFACCLNLKRPSFHVSWKLVPQLQSQEVWLWTRQVVNDHTQWGNKKKKKRRKEKSSNKKPQQQQQQQQKRDFWTLTTWTWVVRNNTQRCAVWLQFVRLCLLSRSRTRKETQQTSKMIKEQKGNLNWFFAPHVWLQFLFFFYWVRKKNLWQSQKKSVFISPSNILLQPGLLSDADLLRELYQPQAHCL